MSFFKTFKQNKAYRQMNRRSEKRAKAKKEMVEDFWLGKMEEHKPHKKWYKDHTGKWQDY